jgi:hypothetical protein
MIIIILLLSFPILMLSCIWLTYKIDIIRHPYRINFYLDGTPKPKTLLIICGYCCNPVYGYKNDMPVCEECGYDNC